jgi:hypothetical protein
MFSREVSREEVEYICSLMGMKIRAYGGQLYASCPLASHLHPKGKDSSKGLSIKAVGPGIYNCHGCDNKGTLFDLTYLYAQYEKDERPHQEIKKILNVLDFQVPKIQYGSHRRGRIARMLNKAKDAEYEITEEIFQEKFLPHVHLDYLKSRGVGEKQILRWEIGFDQKESRVVFPARSWGTRKFLGITGRTILPDGEPKWKHYLGLKTASVLFGEHILDASEPRAYLVEGVFDVLRLRGLGVKNVMAVLGSTLSEEHRKKLCHWFKEVVFIPDFDDQGTGMKYVDGIVNQLKIEGKDLSGVGIAGVHHNKDYVFRYPKPPKWENSDFRFSPISDLLGLDPGEFKSEHVSIALSHIVWI